jgi:hypothetical protein
MAAGDCIDALRSELAEVQLKLSNALSYGRPWVFQQRGGC